MSQGGVLSPILFSFLSCLPIPPPAIEIVTYADDIIIPASSTESQYIASANINVYLETLLVWLRDRKLELPPDKILRDIKPRVKY